MICTFVDTSAWVALIDQTDQHHKVADEFYHHFKQPFLTTNFIINETITLLRNKLSHELAAEAAHGLYGEKVAKLIRITTETERDALKLFEKYNDKTFSFTDCTSFVVMQNMDIKQAFTFDKHFQQMGFTKVP